MNCLKAGLVSLLMCVMQTRGTASPSAKTTSLVLATNAQYDSPFSFWPTTSTLTPKIPNRDHSLCVWTHKNNLIANQEIFPQASILLFSLFQAFSLLGRSAKNSTEAARARKKKKKKQLRKARREKAKERLRGKLNKWSFRLLIDLPQGPWHDHRIVVFSCHHPFC